MPDSKIIVTMEDGSIFTMPDDRWVKAFRIKYGGEEKEALSRFKYVVAKHWRERTIPTKFDWDEPWEEDYSDQASLGRDVMYQFIRIALLAVVMEESALEQGGDWQPKVLGIGEEGVTEYTGHGKRKISAEEAFGPAKADQPGRTVNIKRKREKRPSKLNANRNRR